MVDAKPVVRNSAGTAWQDCEKYVRNDANTAWIKVWPLLAASIAPNPAQAEATSTAGTPVAVSVGVNCTATGGTVQSYAWSRVSGDTAITINNTAISNPTFSIASGTNEVHYSAVWQCVVTFTGGATITATVSVVLDRWSDL